MEPEGLLFSQEPAAGPYPETEKSTPPLTSHYF
jgi:hypothetical protein